MERPFDENVLLELASGNRERAAGYIRMFAASLPSYSRKLRDALAQNRNLALQDCAHDLAGAAAYCGARPLYHAAKHLDAVAAHGSNNEVEPLVQHIADEIDRLLGLRLDRFE